MTFEELISKGFQIENGKFYTREFEYTGFELSPFGFGEPIQYVVRGIGIENEYRILQDAYGNWYLRKNYSMIKRLYHQGEKNWKSF